jgi:hypothetical protein
MDWCNTMNVVLLTNVVLASCWINLKNYPAILLFCMKRAKIFPFPLLWLLFFTFFRGESSLHSSGELWWASHILFYSTCMGSFGRWKISHTVCEDHFHQWIKYRTNLCKKYCRGRISIWSLFCSSTDHDLLNLDKNAG